MPRPAALAALAVVLLTISMPARGAEVARAVAETSQTIASTYPEASARLKTAPQQQPRLPLPAAGALAPPSAAALPLPGALAPPSAAALLATKAHEGAVKLLSGASGGAGSETTLGGGMRAYLAAPKAPSPKSAIILYSDIFGWRGNGTRLWADRLAAQGFVTAVPDFFQGRSAAPGPTQAEDRAFIIALPKANVTRDAGAVAKAIKQKYPSVTKIAAYGFCWGGRYAAVAAGTGAGPARVDAAVAYHASLVSPDEFAAISRPILFVNAAGDLLFNATAVAEAEKAQRRNARGAVALKSYEGVRHGFAVRAMPNDTVATAAAESAFQDGLAFLKKQGVAP